jgi:hypothetical protein
MGYKEQALYIIVILLSGANTVSAQDLDPRAYARAPIDATVLIAGFNYTYGSVVLDPTSPIQDLEARSSHQFLVLLEHLVCLV